MSKSQRFFICEHCKNLVGLIDDGSVPMVCCGETMEEIIPNTQEAATEKHIPCVEKTDIGIKVCVGSVLHPMTEEHHIGFVYVATEKGGQRKSLKISEDPCTEFVFVDDTPLDVYAYCNLHGLWKLEL